MTRRRSGWPAVGLALVVLAGTSAADEPPWHELPLPGGVPALAATAGLDPGDRWRALLDATHRLHVGPISRENRDAVVAYLDAIESSRPHPGNGSATAGAPATTTVPLPLTLETWRAVILPREAQGNVLRAILTLRPVGLTYRGLVQLDEATLRALGDDRRTLSAVARRLYGPFSAFAGSLRVRDGRVVPPGDPGATPLWEDAVGESVRKPGTFIVKLLEKDQGRLAYLYDTIDRLDDARRAFALGVQIADPKRRAERFHALVDVFARSRGRWEGGLGRPLVDASRLLWTVRVTPSGGLAPPWRRGFWSAVFRGDEPAAEGVQTGDDQPLDAAELAASVEGLAPHLAARRFEMVRFAQRAFAEAPPGTEADQVVAVRGLDRHRALVLTLERLGVTRPGLYAAAVRRAEALDRAGEATLLAEVQGALGLVDRARLARVIDADAAAGLVSSLVGLEPSAEGRYGCAIGGWIDGELLPRLAAGLGSSTAAESADSLVVRGIAGARQNADLAEIEWEGFRYRVDVGGAEMRRLLAVRERQGGPTLEATLAFCRAIAKVGEPGLTTDDELARRLESLRNAARAVASPPGEPRDRHADASAVAAAFSDAARRDGRDAERLARHARPVVAHAETLLARVLASLAYAAALGPPDSTALVGGDPSRRHDFGLDGSGPGPWTLPVEARDAVGWRVRGSLLGLDVGLAQLSTRRLTTEPPLQAPGLPSEEGLSFVEGVALLNPFDLADADRDAITASIRRGRERAARLAADGTGRVELADEARLDPVRRNALSWVERHEPQALEGLFSLDELFWLGRPEAARPWDAWGASSLRSEARLGLAFPLPGAREEVYGQVPVGQRACFSPDLHLRIAVALEELRLPAALAKAVLAYAVQDLTDTVRPAHFEDWSAITAFVRGLSRERIEDYVASLVDQGPLVPLTRESR